MSKLMTLRLGSETRRRIERIARSRGTSASEIVREAIHSWLDSQVAAPSPYDSIADLIGIVDGGDPNRSRATGRQFARLLAARRKTS